MRIAALPLLDTISDIYVFLSAPGVAWAAQGDREYLSRDSFSAVFSNQAS